MLCAASIRLSNCGAGTLVELLQELAFENCRLFFERVSPSKTQMPYEFRWMMTWEVTKRSHAGGGSNSKDELINVLHVIFIIRTHRDFLAVCRNFGEVL